MSIPTLIALAVGLGMDAFAVCVAAGMTIEPITPRHVFRLAFHFGLFQFMMPILGWAAGTTFAQHVTSYDHWIAFVLLGFVGGKMLYEARDEASFDDTSDPSRGLMLVTLSVATSIDALAVGLSMAMTDVSIWFPSVVIGLVAGVMSVVGITCGARFGRRWGHWAQIGGGCLLILIGLRVLLSHLMDTSV